MALIVEDGTIIANADSYVTVAEYNTWADSRFGAGRTTAPVDDAATEILILRAMDYIEQQVFIGNKSTQDQSLQWPRNWAVIDQFSIATDEIPPELDIALFEATYAEEISEGELNLVERKTTGEKVGPVAVTYSDKGSARNINVAVSGALRKLLSSGGSGFSVNRA